MRKLEIDISKLEIRNKWNLNRLSKEKSSLIHFYQNTSIEFHFIDRFKRNIRIKSSKKRILE